MKTPITSCCVCGETIAVPSMRRKTCSFKCRTALIWGKVTDRQCVICGESFTPKKNSDISRACSLKCGHKLMAQIKKELGQGWSDAARQSSARTNRLEEKREERRRQSLGRAHTSPLTAKHSPRHHHAAIYFVKSPKNRIYLVMNTTAFVAANESLFPPETVVWRVKGGRKRSSLSCAASDGLNRLNRGERGVWRGWMKVANTEGKEAVDYLPREFIDWEAATQSSNTQEHSQA